MLKAEAALRISRVVVILRRQQVIDSPVLPQLGTYLVAYVICVERHGKKHFAGRLQRARALSKRTAIIGNVFQHVKTQNDVKTMSWERKLGQILVTQVVGIFLAHQGSILRKFASLQERKTFVQINIQRA